ncbi:hypothetical protein Kisp01_72500 [Kineosporia sp. NBRC 101677]|nr:hypothetical protein Kisp01_72500 [Kineosporia sp. NBRC 101677]
MDDGWAGNDKRVWLFEQALPPAQERRNPVMAACFGAVTVAVGCLGLCAE